VQVVKLVLTPAGFQDRRVVMRLHFMQALARGALSAFGDLLLGLEPRQLGLGRLELRVEFCDLAVELGGMHLLSFKLRFERSRFTSQLRSASSARGDLGLHLRQRALLIADDGLLTLHGLTGYRSSRVQLCHLRGQFFER